jgi:hypothetical protein
VPKVELVRDGLASVLPPMQRAAGAHVSELIHELCLALGHYKDDGGEPNAARMELGNAWEYALIEFIARSDPDRYFKPGELSLEDISGNPDLLDVVEEADVEIKCSFMSSKHGPGSEKFWKYERQLMAYLYMLGWFVGYLHVCFVNGDYKYGPNGGPVYRVWRYEFTLEELEANWRMLKQQAARKAR